ncbi:MAG: aldo/keto reductase [Thomasclavelia sp.]|nr:aldo/keto reductase [Thomasclavelia sp.]
MKKLGFGLMRLPMLENGTDIDIDQLNKMVDTYLEHGFTYFDTSYVYHDGSSEIAIRKALVERHNREDYVLATKLPAFAIEKEEDVDKIFNEQLYKCGVEYFDYFLLHNVNSIRYKTNIKECHMFDHLKQYKEEGKIKHIAISYHDDALSLEKILKEHPEIEAVQIALNYFDMDACLIQAKACYDIICKYQRKVIVMEPVKGGMLASAPSEAVQLMKDYSSASLASWAIRFAASLDNVLVVLSGMSNLKQVNDNISYMEDFKPLNNDELEILGKVIPIYEKHSKMGIIDYKKYESINQKGINARVILETYNHCMLQPNPGFAAEGNYFSIEKAKHNLKREEPCFDGKVVVDGNDITDDLNTAQQFLQNHAFYWYM